ncbi:MAG: hypothetical protein QOJ50_1717, partial [Cryptosporangiaceae bacterium]|nr:hypothetical protein [Cryptosporangiaceae bacterium]
MRRAAPHLQTAAGQHQQQGNSDCGDAEMTTEITGADQSPHASPSERAEQSQREERACLYQSTSHKA